MSGYEDPNCLICGVLYPGRTEPGVQEVMRGVGVCPSCRADAEMGKSLRENKRKIRRAFHDTGHRCDATAICQGIVDMIEAMRSK
jgi:hypothetical protein